MMATDITNTADIIDVRDIIERFEELETLEGSNDASNGELYELDQLQTLLDELRGNGGDHQWRGAWYPGTLVRDSYFTEYAQELAEDAIDVFLSATYIGAVSSDASWPAYCIDWERAARDLRMDYTSVDYDGVTYWCR